MHDRHRHEEHDTVGSAGHAGGAYECRRSCGSTTAGEVNGADGERPTNAGGGEGEGGGDGEGGGGGGGGDGGGGNG